MADIANLTFRVDTSGLTEAERGLDEVTESAGRAATAVDRFQGEVAQGTARLSPMRSTLGSVGDAFNRNQFAIQNASFQLSDFVTQVSMGTSATRALSVQLPQLAGGFGAVGAVVGTLAGLALALVPTLFSMGEEAEDTGNAMENLGAALQGVAEISEMLGPTLRQNLVVVFQESAESVERLFDRVEEIRLETLQSGIQSAIAVFTEQAGIAEAIEQFDREVRARMTVGSGERSAEMARQVVASQFEAEFDITIEQAQELQQLLEGISGNTAAELAQSMAEVADQARGMGEFGQRLADALAEAADESGVLPQALSEADAFLANSASSAAQLARELEISVAAASRLMSMGAGQQEVVLDPRDPDFDPIAAEMARIREEGYSTRSPFDPSRADTETASTVGRSTRSTGPSDAAIARQAREEGRFQQEQIDRYDELAAAQDEWLNKMQEGDRIGNALNQTFSSFFSDAISGTKSLEESFGQMLNNLAGQFAAFAAELAAQELLSSIFGGGSDGGGGLNITGILMNAVVGGLTGSVGGTNFASASAAQGAGLTFAAPSGIAPLADGGVLGPGGGILNAPVLFPMADGMGLAGEAGPEAVMPLKRGPDGKLGVSSSMPTINIINNTGQPATTRKRENGDLDVIIGAARQAVAADIRSDGNAISDALTQRGSPRTNFR